MGNLSHRGVVTIYEARLSGEEPYIAQEFVGGGRTLKRYIEEIRARGVPPSDHYRAAAGMMAQVCDALHYAHEQGVLHCDIKPSNILVADDGAPKLADFGIGLWADDVDRTTTALSARRAT